MVKSYSQLHIWALIIGQICIFNLSAYCYNPAISSTVFFCFTMKSSLIVRLLFKMDPILFHLGQSTLQAPVFLLICKYKKRINDYLRSIKCHAMGYLPCDQIGDEFCARWRCCWKRNTALDFSRVRPISRIVSSAEQGGDPALFYLKSKQDYPLEWRSCKIEHWSFAHSLLIYL